MRKTYWGCTLRFYFGAASIEIEPAMPVFGGIGIRTNFRIYGKRYWAFKRRIRKIKERAAQKRLKNAARKNTDKARRSRENGQ